MNNEAASCGILLCGLLLLWIGAMAGGLAERNVQIRAWEARIVDHSDVIAAIRSRVIEERAEKRAKEIQ